MKNTEGYVREITHMKEKYKKDIEVYLGIEEDAFYPSSRVDFDYIIGSSHYCFVDGTYYPIDSNYDYFKKCLSLFNNDPISMAHAYYKPFCDYIHKTKPDIIGHFDLITKFDESKNQIFLENQAYTKIAEEYIQYAAKSGCFFEVNTGAISRGLRTTPYPYQNLLYILKKNGNGIVLSSDSHDISTLAYGFNNAKLLLKDIGFTYTYILHKGKFIKENL